MKLRRSVRGTIFGLTATKEALLRQEWDSWQSYLRGNCNVALYAATRQVADRLLQRLGRRRDPQKLYPLLLRNDTIKVESAREATWSRWWFKVPVANLRGGLWCPIQVPYRQEELLGLDLRECKLIRKRDHWAVCITVLKEVPDPPTLIPDAPSVLGVDLGEVRPATAVLIADGEPVSHVFASRQVRRLRMHYNWLRRRLQLKNSRRTVRKVGRVEHRRVDALLHPLAKQIVALAAEHNAAIAIGDLKGIRRRSEGKGKNFRAKVARMPAHRLASFIEYKALWAGVPLVYVDEA
jgi:IS605 OrfB family transposase